MVKTVTDLVCSLTVPDVKQAELEFFIADILNRRLQSTENVDRRVKSVENFVKSNNKANKRIVAQMKKEEQNELKDIQNIAMLFCQRKKALLGT